MPRWLAAACLTLTLPGPIAAGESPVEEIVVTVVRRCGDWPVAHVGVSVCEYPELKAKHLPQLRARRPELVQACLVCDHDKRSCEPRLMPRAMKQAERLCRSFFWTPVQTRAMFVSEVMATDFLDASISYDISRGGRIENIAVTFLEGWSERSALRLLREGARRNRYEPLMIDGHAYAITNLQAEYTLEEP